MKKSELKGFSQGIRLIQFLDRMDAPVFWITILGKISYVNDAACRFLGYSREEMLKLSVAHLEPDFSPSRWSARWQELKRKSSLIFESRHRTRDGKIIPVEITAVPVDLNGTPAHIAVAQNITERKKVLEYLEKSEKLYRDLADSIPQTVFEMDLEGNLTFVNRSALETFGYTQAEFQQGLNGFDMFMPGERDRVRQRIQEVIKGRTSSQEYTARKKDGSSFPVLIHSTPVFENGKPVRIRGILVDISERKAAEEALERSERIARRLALENSIIARIGRIISSRIRIEEVYDRFAREAGKLISFDVVAVNLINPKEHTVTVTYVSGAGPFEPRGTRVGKVFPLKNSLTEVMFRTRSASFFQPETKKGGLGRFPFISQSLRAGFRSVMSAPLIYRDRVIGSLTFRSKARKAYAEDDLRLAERIAHQIAGAIGTAKLFEDYRRAQEALLKSDNNYRAIFENTGTATFINEGDMTISNVNSRAVRLLGYPRREIVGRKWTEMVLPEDLDRLKSHHHAIREDKRSVPKSFESRLVDRWGRVKDVLLTVGLIPGTKRSVASTWDISEKKAAEKKIRESESRYRLLAENVTDVIWTVDTQMRFTFVSPSVVHLTGYSAAEVQGLALKEILPPSSWEFSKKVLTEESAIESPPQRPRSRTIVAEVIRKDGMTVWTESTVNFLRDKQGRLFQALGVTRDITARRKVEEQLRHSNEQLRAFSTRIQGMREEERARLAREIHDEMGQALTGLKINLTWLMGRLPEKTRELKVKAREMSRLIDTTVQSVRRLSSDLRPGILDDFGLAAAIEWQARDFQARTGIQCRINGGLQDLEMAKDIRTAVFRIFQEALTNVARHARASRIIVRLKKEKESVLLEVRDNGRGITEREITDRKSLGLLGMRERAQLFGGKIRIQGTPCKGTSIQLRIPIEFPPP